MDENEQVSNESRRRPGRGAGANPPGRFERSWHEREFETVDSDLADPDQVSTPRTEFLTDASRTIVARNQSPDIPFDASLNPYRGCEHGCSYCYARPTHEYLGFSAGLDFETKILVKHDAPELLRKTLLSPSWKPTPLAMSGVTDAYQPVERRLRLTRRCLEVLVEFRNPVSVVTKNRLVTRDLDLLGELARHEAAIVFLSVTTLDRALARALEPRASSPDLRLGAIEALAGAGVPVGVMLAPVIPGLTDHEMPAILAAAARAGARHAGYVPLRLPLTVAPLFEVWLDRHAPGKKVKILGRLRGLRQGKLNDARFGSRIRGEGAFASVLDSLFRSACLREGLNLTQPRLSCDAFRRPHPVERGRQLQLFD
ncbi:MAG: PA0069 family radical SAM protein [Isosphaeraceae bacterium]